MGKRSTYKRAARDFYPTPNVAIAPLIPWLPTREFEFVDPCAGDGRLVNYLHSTSKGRCIDAYDIEPPPLLESPMIPGFVRKQDALAVAGRASQSGVYLITNPPWNRKFLHAALDLWLPTDSAVWVLLDAGWMHTKQAIPYMTYCERIVSVGRVKWIPGSLYSGKDDCCWYKFGNFEALHTIFTGRTR